MSHSSHTRAVTSRLSRVAATILATAALVAFGTFTYFATQASIIADDFSYFHAYEQVGNPISYVTHHYMTHNGRLGQAAFFAFAYAVFGQASLQIVPVFMLVMIVSLVAYMVRRLVALTVAPLVVSYSVAALFTVGALILTPSMFDSFLWLTSSTVYLGGLTFTLLVFSLALSMSFKDVRLPGILVLFLVTLWAGMFTEPLTVCTGLTGFVILLSGVFTGKGALRRLGLPLWLGSIVAFALIYFSPGTAARREYYGTDISIGEILKSLPANFRLFTEHSQEWGYLLVVAAALAVYGFASTQWHENLKFRKLLMVTVLVFLIYFVGQIFIARTGSPEIALRTFTNPTFALASCCALVVLALVRLLAPRKEQQSVVLVLPCILLGLSLISAVTYVQTVSQALTMRATQLEVRAQSVADQLASGDAHSPVELKPLNTPLVSEAVDLNYSDVPQIEWVLDAISTWYGVETERVVIGQEPQGYCLPASPIVKSWMTCNMP